MNQMIINLVSEIALKYTCKFHKADYFQTIFLFFEWYYKKTEVLYTSSLYVTNRFYKSVIKLKTFDSTVWCHREIPEGFKLRLKSLILAHISCL